MMRRKRQNAGRSSPSRRCAWFVCVVALIGLTNCSRERVSEDELAFYEKVRQIRKGTPFEDVRRALGEPSLVINAEAECLRSGAQREWMYRSFDLGTGRKQLQFTKFAFCASADGRVVQVLEIVD